jgi:hypothetical protein
MGTGAWESNPSFGIGILHQITLAEGRAKNAPPEFKNQAALIEFIVAQAGDLEGLSKRKLEGVFPKALNALNVNSD